MSEQPNAPLTFRWYHALFNMQPYILFMRNVELMESHIHQYQAQGVNNLRRIDLLSEQLDTCRNRIAVLTGAANETNLPYTVRGNHGAAQDRPKSDVRSSDMACDSNKRSRQQGFASHAHESQMVQPQSDNTALYAAAAVAVMSMDDSRAEPEPEIPAQAVPCAPAYREPETPAYVAPTPSYCAPEPVRESYSPPSRSDNDYTPSSSNDSAPSGCD